MGFLNRKPMVRSNIVCRIIVHHGHARGDAAGGAAGGRRRARAELYDVQVAGALLGARAGEPPPSCMLPLIEPLLLDIFVRPRVQASVHTSRTNTAADGTFTDADVAVLAKFPLITIEKWQGQDATVKGGRGGVRVFVWEEDAWIRSAKKIKAVAPHASVVPWMDTMLVYTGWYLNGSVPGKGDASFRWNHTLNPDATAACATGHFRVAEDIEKRPSMLVKNMSGALAISAYGSCHMYDHAQTAVRQYWRDNCLAIANAGLDGCGADFSAGDHNAMARNSVEDTMAFMGVDNATAVAWRAGRRRMMIDTTAALGDGLLIGKDAAELGDHVNAVLHEGCGANNGTITLLRSITAKSRATGKRLLYQCHTTGGMGNTTVAAFLIGAGVDHYIASGGWHAGDARTPSGDQPLDYWHPILDQPLGEPTADAAYDSATKVWTRTFASGTKVSFDAGCPSKIKGTVNVCPNTYIRWGKAHDK